MALGRVMRMVLMRLPWGCTSHGQTFIYDSHRWLICNCRPMHEFVGGSAGMGDAAGPINVILDGPDGLGGERLVGGVRDVGLELRSIQHQRHWMGRGDVRKSLSSRESPTGEACSAPVHRLLGASLRGGGLGMLQMMCTSLMATHGSRAAACRGGG